MAFQPEVAYVDDATLGRHRLADQIPGLELAPMCGEVEVVAVDFPLAARTAAL